MRVAHQLMATSTFPARPLAITRILIGFAAALKCAITAPILVGLAAEQALRIPVMTGVYPTRAAVLLIIATWGAAAGMLVIGWRTRPAAAALTAAVAMTLLLDQQLYSNNLYLLGVMALLVAVADTGAALSIDARTSVPRDVVPAYPAFLMMAMPPIVYLFAGLSKINGYWLSGGILHGSLRDGPLSVPATLRAPDLLALAAAATVLLEVFVALGLLVPRTRSAAVLGGAVAHLGMVAVLKGPLELFGFALTTMSVYHLYFYLQPAPYRATSAGVEAQTGKLPPPQPRWRTSS